MKVDQLLIQRRTITKKVTEDGVTTTSQNEGAPDAYDVPNKEGAYEEEIQKIAQINMRKREEAEKNSIQAPPYSYSYTELVVVDLVFPQGKDKDGRIFDEGEEHGFEKVKNPH